MKFLNSIHAAVRALPILLLAALLPGVAIAQSVTPYPIYVKSRTSYDFGNGPLKVRVLQGSFWVFTSLGTATSTAVSNSTAMVLTATPATPPCVGCVISGAGITPGTTVAAYNGTTGITLSAAMTVANGTVVSFGAACPTTNLNAPPQSSVQAGAGNPDAIMYTYARVCGAGHVGPGASVSVFPTSVF